MASRRVIEDYNDPRYGEYVYDDEEQAAPSYESPDPLPEPANMSGVPYDGPPAPAAPTAAPVDTPRAAEPVASSGPRWLDLNYINSEIDRGFQQGYGRAPTPDERQYWVNKALTPDTYTGGNIHKGWNPYLYDRLVRPGSSSSGVDPGTDTIIGYDNSGPTRGSGASAPSVQINKPDITQAMTPAATPAFQTGPAPTFTQVQSPLNDAARAAIQQLLATPQTLDQTALQSSPENTAYKLSQQRTEERQRRQLVERNAAQGLSNTGATDSQIRGLSQARGANEADFLGKLAVTRMQQQREQLTQGITFAMQDGQFQQAQALQQDLAKLDAAIRRESIRASQQESSANRTENARQFGLGLGYSYTALEQQANADALRALLGQ